MPVYTAEDPSTILRKNIPHLFCVLVGITIQLFKKWKHNRSVPQLWSQHTSRQLKWTKGILCFLFLFGLEFCSNVSFVNTRVREPVCCRSPKVGGKQRLSEKKHHIVRLCTVFTGNKTETELFWNPLLPLPPQSVTSWSQTCTPLVLLA